MKRSTYLFLLITLALLTSCGSEHALSDYQFDPNELLLTNNNQDRIRIRSYGPMLRIQYAESGKEFFPDDHYEMVEDHEMGGEMELNEYRDSLVVKSGQTTLVISKDSLTLSYYLDSLLVLDQKFRFNFSEDSLINLSLTYDSSEHFTGLGHGYFGRSESIDLRSKKIKRNYGSQHGEQAPLIVPFYMSSKGYGVFLNSTFPNEFTFGKDLEYSFGIETHGFEGQMDFFLIPGPTLPEVLENYLELTGKPRLPQLSIFGLQLSDKGHDHTTNTPSDEIWWKNKIMEHRKAGFALDHIVNDNRWRAGGGTRCESFIEWDSIRYPDPAGYASWAENEGLTMTIDLNRCIAAKSEGWRPEFNLPITDKIDFNESAPDLTNAEFRTWFWELFYSKSLDPALNYPGDALWIDEFDEQGNAPLNMMLNNGRSSAEMRNYWFFLVAKSLVQNGWDQSPLRETKRPYVWVRGMTAGAQRYATLWSGDIKPTVDDMRYQIRSMQLAGLSGFPFWGHDAGGFYDWENNTGPDEDLYKKWALGMGCFSPIWKPHGMGQSRWPLDRSERSQEAARDYVDLRYRMLAYTYSNAIRSAQGNLPIARAMVLHYQDEENAWNYDLQYMWGDDLLIAPQHTDDETELWLPPGRWFDFWNDQLMNGDQVINYRTEADQIPIMVKEGAIIPMYNYAKSTAFIDKKYLTIHIYTGADNTLELLEDDGISEAYQTGNYQTTSIEFQNDPLELRIGTTGDYENAPNSRIYQIIFHGIDQVDELEVNGELVRIGDSADQQLEYHSVEQKLILSTKKYKFPETLIIRNAQNNPPS